MMKSAEKVVIGVGTRDEDPQLIIEGSVGKDVTIGCNIKSNRIKSNPIESNRIKSNPC